MNDQILLSATDVSFMARNYRQPVNKGAKNERQETQSFPRQNKTPKPSFKLITSQAERERESGASKGTSTGTGNDTNRDTGIVQLVRTMKRLDLWHRVFPCALLCSALFGKGCNNISNAFTFTSTSTSTSISASRSKASTVSSTELFGSSLTDPLPYPIRIAVMGGGNFGLALATICGRQGIQTTILVRSDTVADHINEQHNHPSYCPDIPLPKSIRATTDAALALSDATYIIHAVPCQYSRNFLNSVNQFIPPTTPILSVSKGIESTSLGFMNEILEDCLGDERQYAFLSGPSFAREIREGVATAVVIASDDLDLARDLAGLLSDDTFRAFTSKDVVGVEIGGAVKNVIALAAGICDGLGLGTNAKSTLVTRGCGEMRRLAMTFGAQPSTIAGLSGAGDTFGTCFGPLSRNRKFGFELGQGRTMDDILSSTTEVAEGVATAIALVNLIRTKVKGYRLDLKYPILFAVASILEGKTTPKVALDGFFSMPMQMENFDERTFAED